MNKKGICPLNDSFTCAIHQFQYYVSDGVGEIIPILLAAWLGYTVLIIVLMVIYDVGLAEILHR